MTKQRLKSLLVLVVVFGLGFLAGRPGAAPPADAAEATLPETTRASEAEVGTQANRVFELRTYTANEGKFEDLLARFRNHTLRIFEKHGMTNIGYWIPQDDELSGNTLVYLLAHPSREAADASWRAFGSDPEWQRVAEESQRNGRLIANLQRQYLDPTDFSPMK